MALRLEALTCALLLILAPAASAQQAVTTAGVSGRVSDQTGMGIPGAAVVLKDLERNQVVEATTSPAGEFRFIAVALGAYELTVTCAGFSPKTARFHLNVGDAIEVPITLAVAGVEAAVTVAADSVVIEAWRTQMAANVTPAEIDKLPLNGRNYLDLALLVPGVTRTVQRNTERFAETSAVPGTGISVAGQRNLNNTFIVDGLSANDDAAGLAGTYFAEDVIQEFQVVTSGGIAEFGRASAGIINVVTRSGTNRNTGRAYMFFRDDWLDARNVLATREDPLTQAQYGVTFSGPIVRNRTFWFGNAERTDLDRMGIITIRPTDAAAVNATLDSMGYRADRVTTGEFPTGYTTGNLFGRVDHSASPKDRIALRYSFYNVTSQNARSVGGLNTTSRGTSLKAQDQTLAFNWLSTASGTVVNEFRAQATRSRLEAPPNDFVGPAVGISGVVNFGTSTTSPTDRDLDVYEASNSVSVLGVDHLFKFGGAVLYETLDVEFPGVVQGSYTFSSLANFQAGRYTTYQQAFGEIRQPQKNPNLSLFAQDEWRPLQRLTVNAGLRYDVQWMEDIVQTDTNNVSPRLGMSYAPSEKTVIRAAGGLFFDRIPLRAVSNALQRDGIKYQVAQLSFGQPGAPVFPNVLPGFPAGLRTNITTIQRDIQSGGSRQVSFEVMRQIGLSMAASIGYMHLTGHDIIMSRNINVPTLTAAQAAALGDTNLGRPDPRYGNNGQFQSIGRSRYNGMTLALNTRQTTWGSLRASYTLSKALDDAGNAFFSSPQDANDVAASTLR